MSTVLCLILSTLALAGGFKNEGRFAPESSRLIRKNKDFSSKVPKELTTFFTKHGYQGLKYNKKMDASTIGNAFDILYMNAHEKMISVKFGQRISEIKYNQIYSLKNELNAQTDDLIKIVHLKNKRFHSMTITFYGFSDNAVQKFGDKFLPYYKRKINRKPKTALFDFFSLPKAHAAGGAQCSNGKVQSLGKMALYVAGSCIKDMVATQLGALASFVLNKAYDAAEKRVKGENTRFMDEVRTVWEKNLGKYPRTKTEWWEWKKKLSNLKQYGRAAISFVKDYLLLKMKQMGDAWNNLKKNWDKIPTETVGKVFCGGVAAIAPGIACSYGFANQCAKLATNFLRLPTRVNQLISQGLAATNAVKTLGTTAGLCAENARKVERSEDGIVRPVGHPGDR